VKIRFNVDRGDSQATVVEPVEVDAFDFEAYADYEAELLQRCRAFWRAESGVLVYRRMRVEEVFSYGCRDMKASLAWQLGALQKSMLYKADVPNFLEPWYGIGTVASAFGCGYLWRAGQAPMVERRFDSVAEALEYEAVPVAETAIGRHTLEMIDYFVDKTRGKVPISLTDTQSPLNVACHVVDMKRLFMALYDEPEAVRRLLERIAHLLVAFTAEQIEQIGESLVWPGHGFASCRCFGGLGVSDDLAVMISDGQYLEFAAGAVSIVAEAFGGWAFHSCGDWSAKAGLIRRLAGIRMVDGAFSAATDPSPNPAEPFAEVFAGSGIVVHARVVGDVETVEDVVRRLWRDGMKLIVATYCQSPEEQAEAYERIHRVCEG